MYKILWDKELYVFVTTCEPTQYLKEQKQQQNVKYTQKRLVINRC